MSGRTEKELRHLLMAQGACQQCARNATELYRASKNFRVGERQVAALKQRAELVLTRCRNRECPSRKGTGE